MSVIFAFINPFQCHGSADIRVGCSRFVTARAESFPFSVIEPQVFFIHQLTKDVICGRKNRFIASEILIKVNPAVYGFFFITEGIVFIEENSGVCLAESINRLFDIAYHETVPPVRN